MKATVVGHMPTHEQICRLKLSLKQLQQTKLDLRRTYAGLTAWHTPELMTGLTPGLTAWLTAGLTRGLTPRHMAGLTAELSVELTAGLNISYKLVKVGWICG